MIRGKRIAIVCIAALMLMSTFAYAETKATITAYFDRVNLVVNGQPVDKQTLLYSGTTYVPIKATAEMLGMNVTYDGETKTAYLDDPKDQGKDSNKNVAADAAYVDIMPVAEAGATTPEAITPTIGAVAPESENEIILRTETKATIIAYFDRIKLVVNGQPLDKQTLLYDGTTYVPVKAAAEMLGMTVTYDDGTKTAYLNAPKDQGQSPGGDGAGDTTPGATTTDPGTDKSAKDQLPPPGLGDVTYGPVVGMGKNDSDAGNYVTMLIFGRELTFDTKTTGVDTETLYKAKFNAKSVATLTEYVISGDREGILGSIQNSTGKVDGNGIPAGAIKGSWSGNILSLTLNGDVDTTSVKSSGILSGVSTSSAVTVTVDKDKKVYVLEKGKYTTGSASDVKSCRAIGLYDFIDKDKVIDLILVIK